MSKGIQQSNLWQRKTTWGEVRFERIEGPVCGTVCRFSRSLVNPYKPEAQAKKANLTSLARFDVAHFIGESWFSFLWRAEGPATY